MRRSAGAGRNRQDVLNVEKRNAVKAAFTDLQMRQKEAFGLGAITGPDMQVLEGAYTDPTGIAGMLKGGLTGTKAFTAQIDQGRAALNRTKRNFEQQYKVELPDPAGTVTAPMPGMIVNYEKNVGDSVSQGETVVILEAMKMENALPAPSSGVIKSVHFSSGDSVAKGDVLAIIG